MEGYKCLAPDIYRKMGVNRIKKELVLFVVICLLIFTSCAKKTDGYDKSVGSDDTITHDINGTSNADRLLKFTDNIKKGKKDRINIIKYTTEGDPIIAQLYFNGKNIEAVVDNTKDKFAGDSRKIKYDTIKGGSKLIDNLMEYLNDNNF
jgi:hypothetical protein